MIETKLLEMKNITKLFPGVRALDRVDFSLQTGDVHALLGENGAGKSTLIKILSGVYDATEGQIFINGKKVTINTPFEALQLGIVPVHQEVNLSPLLSVAENIFIGRQPVSRFGLIDYKKMYIDAKNWLSELQIKVNPATPLGMVSIAEKQMVAIARAISLDAKILIFDEPTSSLTLNETDNLFNAIEKLKKRDIGIIYISHRLEEVFRICNRLTVMRDGAIVGNREVSEVNTDTIIKMMVGRDLGSMYSKTKNKIGEPILELKGLAVKGVFSGIDLVVRSGEIVGVAGLVGAGRTELARAICGDLPISGGQVLISGLEKKIKNPSDAIKAGIGLVPEDRKDEGLVLELPITNNISMTILKLLSKLGLVDEKKEREIATQNVKRLAIKTPSIKQPVQFLSGGNQQRVVIAKWLATQPRLLIVDEPTRGIDVGAKSEIYALLSDLTRAGVGILMISSELPEILAMSDRIIVIYQGRVKAELDTDKTSEEEIMRYATGQS